MKNTRILVLGLLAVLTTMLYGCGGNTQAASLAAVQSDCLKVTLLMSPEDTKGKDLYVLPAGIKYKKDGRCIEVTTITGDTHSWCDYYNITPYIRAQNE